MLVAGIPFLAGHPFPMWWAETGVHPYPVGDALDETPRASPKSIVLEAMHHLMGKNTQYLVRASGSIDPVNIVKGHVDLFVIRVELGPCAVGNAIHGSEDKGNGAGWRRRCSLRGRRLVEERENILDGYCESLAGVDGGEKRIGTSMIEIAHLKTEFWEGKPWFRGLSWRLHGGFSDRWFCGRRWAWSVDCCYICLHNG